MPFFPRPSSPLALFLALGLLGCGGGAPLPPSSPSQAVRSAKRGIAYDFADPADVEAMGSGVAWWYNWSASSAPEVSAETTARLGMEFVPMVWNGNFKDSDITAYLTAHPAIKYLLVLNEPNQQEQANLTPLQAAGVWPRYEAIAAQTGVSLVGPAMTWGNLPGYGDPVVWLDAFYAAYRASHGQRDPRIDFLAFHWYDYGLSVQLDRLAKYHKAFWVTEFANCHSQRDGAQIDTIARQEAQMKEMVALCERRRDVFRYAWFTGRQSPDPHYASLLKTRGRLTALGTTYLALPTS